MTDRQQHHIVMLPFMAQGHLIPFLALANKIHRRFGFTITIATTPLNVAYLQTALSSSPNQQSSPPPPSIHLSSLEFNASAHGLPPNTENTEALPLSQIINLFHSSATLRPPFQSLIRRISAADGAPPLCIISDVFMGWANEVALSFGTHNIAFTTGGAFGTATYASLWQHLPHKKTADENGCFNIPGFPDSCVFHVTQMHRFLRAADGTDTWSKFFRPQIAHSLSSFGWLCNTAEEVEPFGLYLLRKFTKTPVWAVGPLIPPTMLLSRSSRKTIGQQQQHTGRVPGASAEKCVRWLDGHPKRSVLYISFGSQNSISECQMLALAMGLEDSRRAFIWVVRPPVGFDSRGEFKPEWLPHGFEERVVSSGMGLVVHGWAPQLEILCHESTGAFMSHCGWNSTMESLSQGVPMVGWPLAAEQGYNAKMLAEEMGVCVEIARGVDSGVSREWVKEVVERVIMCEEMRRKAGRVGELIRAGLSETGSSNQALDQFVSALLSKTTSS